MSLNLTKVGLNELINKYTDKGEKKCYLEKQKRYKNLKQGL